jgi:hypothetical protein
MDLTSKSCECAACGPLDASGLTASLLQRSALASLAGTWSTGRVACPRCSEGLGPTEIVVDSVGHAHKVQACGACSSLWVAP